MSNKLTSEKSPYLLQHAENPVNWYPWGEEAFKKAGREDKPVFLSIGYSTCHWCHVMAHESFEDEATAALLNEYFVAIKLDREERPDIDAVYMAVCQALTGSGGWPLSIVMTPSQQPFFAGTYLPKTTRHGMMGLQELLLEIARQWRENRAELIASGQEITAFVKRQAEHTVTGLMPERELLHRAKENLAARFDDTFGGFGEAPKFPAPHNLLFLMRYHSLFGDESALAMSEHTLDSMYKGGLFDHIGGGFCRYSTDRLWLVPHFEKMLYDNALMALATAAAYQKTRREIYRTITKRTLDYVLRELTNDEGAFFCAQDADSDHEEGRYYVFTPREVTALLGERAAEVCSWLDITERGNFEGKSIPNLIKNPRWEEESPLVTPLLPTLAHYRRERAALHKDDKVLTSWNALMIAAFANASRALEEPGYLTAAVNAERFLSALLTGPDGRLSVRWREGQAANMGQLEDYAFYILALLALYGVTFQTHYLTQAARLAHWMLTLFFDSQNGGFYLYAHDSEPLISRPREVYDGALPSGNSAAALALAHLSQLTGREELCAAHEKQLLFLCGAIQRFPAQSTFGLLAVCEALCPGVELVCVTREQSAPHELLALLAEPRAGQISVLLKTPGNQSELTKICPFTESYAFPERGAAYYLCHNRHCEAPVSDIDALRLMLPQ